MSIPKVLTYSALSLFLIIGVTAFFKRDKNQMAKAPQELPAQSSLTQAQPVAIVETPVVSVIKKQEPIPVIPLEPVKSSKKAPAQEISTESYFQEHPKDDFPTIDRIFQLFTTGPSKLPIVETIQYTSSVPWLNGRLAWIADYASHYATSRHFIARSLNGKPDYFSQKVFEGSKFNVFRKDKKIQFYLLVDVSRLKMGFYYVDLGTNERVLLKTYAISVGKLDPSKPSGTLTPLGRYALGDKVVVYQPGIMGIFQDQKVEMVRVLGTRWIPLEHGYGIYGAPWVEESKTGRLIENVSAVGKYNTEGGICMASPDLEELFSIVITKPTFIEIVTDFREAKLPGIEVATPVR
ncbi:MAG: L,D-transpeptidase [Rhabdochlamydiaceae bacterium]|nr:L,D-transpeptidase [Rhabdochlamydiaceae bacterium]